MLTINIHIGTVLIFDKMKLNKVSMKSDKLNNETYYTVNTVSLIS